MKKRSFTAKNPAARPNNEKRFDIQHPAGKFKGGKLAPISCTVVREGEAGVFNMSLSAELAPIAGRMMTPITFGVVSVYVPLQAIDALKYPDAYYPGSADVLRARLLAGENIFDLETEGEITKRMRVIPRSIGGVKKVGEFNRIAHNAAVNYLRQRIYHKATLLDADNMAMTPALLSSTVLTRFNAVLDPEDRINGKIDFTGFIPVRGLGFELTQSLAGSSRTVMESSGETVTYDHGPRTADGPDLFYDVKAREDDPTKMIPNIWADLSGTDGVSLQQFYEAERMDKITRTIGELIVNNPTYGAEIALRWAANLSVDVGAQPFVLYEREGTMADMFRRATDGDNMDVAVTDTMDRLAFTVPVPATEFGGVIVTFAYVKPDETLANQPHPFASDVWKAQNFIADEMALDPVPVTTRDLDAECDSADEGNVIFYTGNNELKRNYVSYGWNRQLDPTTVEAQTALWQYEVPLSVTPDNIVYPEDLGQYPFSDQWAEICTYLGQASFSAVTPIIFGPIPVEEIDVIEDENMFGDNE